MNMIKRVGNHLTELQDHRLRLLAYFLLLVVPEFIKNLLIPKKGQLTDFSILGAVERNGVLI
jgi:hypothetical protein